jgi:hypothetical protein
VFILVVPTKKGRSTMTNLWTWITSKTHRQTRAEEQPLYCDVCGHEIVDRAKDCAHAAGGPVRA